MIARPLNPDACSGERADLSAEPCGRRICAWCVPHRDLGPAPSLAAGQITHGICEECSRRMMEVSR